MSRELILEIVLLFSLTGGSVECEWNMNVMWMLCYAYTMHMQCIQCWCNVDAMQTNCGGNAGEMLMQCVCKMSKKINSQMEEVIPRYSTCE